MHTHNLTTCLRFVNPKEREIIAAEDSRRTKAKLPTVSEDLIFQAIHAFDEPTTANLTIAGTVFEVSMRRTS